MKKVEIKVVNTIKIQSIENGKKITRRRFNFDVYLAPKLHQLIESYFEDVRAEVYAEQRSPKEWVALIKAHTRSNSLRRWAASIIWFKYGGNEDSVLYKLSKQYDRGEFKPKIKQVMMLLERMGCPRFINNFAADRERTRKINIKKLS